MSAIANKTNLPVPVHQSTNLPAPYKGKVVKGRKNSCPVCHAPVKGHRGLAVHNGKASVKRIHAKLQKEGNTPRASATGRNTPTVRVSKLKNKWLDRASQENDAEIREAILECIIDLGIEFK